MSDAFGLQKDERDNVEWSKRLAEAAAPDSEEPSENRGPTLPQDETSAIETYADTPPEPDFTDTVKWVAVDTPEIIDGATLGPATAGFRIATGKLIRTHRYRRDEDGDALVVREDPPAPPEAPKPKFKREFGWHGDWQGGVHPKLLERYLSPDEKKEQTWGEWIRGGTFGRP